MRIRSLLAALVIGLAIAACQPVPGGGGESQAAPNEAPAGSAAPDASATPYTIPNY